MFSEICIITRDITLPSVPLHFRKPRPRPFHFQGINFGPPGRFNKNPSWKVPFWRWFSELPQVGYVNFLESMTYLWGFQKNWCRNPPFSPSNSWLRLGIKSRWPGVWRLDFSHQGWDEHAQCPSLSGCTLEGVLSVLVARWWGCEVLGV